MPALNFKKWKAPGVESGKWTQTIRAKRADGRDPRVGSKLFFYYAQRTKQCRKLGEAVCTEAIPFVIEGGKVFVGDAFTNGAQLLRIAALDGFDDIDAMFDFFYDTHGTPEQRADGTFYFDGILIRWGDVDRSML